MIVYNKYINARDCTWYDSSNVIYSECMDTSEQFKTVKVVFKQGRTYLYKKVHINDYILFKNATSNGTALNEYIKKYECVRIADTDLDKLEQTKQEYIEGKKQSDEAFSNLLYKIDYNMETDEIRLSLNNTTIYEGIENQLSMLKLLKSMSVVYALNTSNNFHINKEE